MTDPSPHILVRPEPGGLCWKRSDRRRYANTPQQHAELVVLQALSGEARYLIDGEVFDLHPGSLLWAFSGQAHMLLSDTDDFDMWVFLVSGKLLTPGLRNRKGMPKLNIDELEEPVRPRSISRGAAAELEAIAGAVRGEPDPQIRAIGITWWLTRAWRHWSDSATAGFVTVHPAVNRAALAMRRDPTASLTNIARQSGLSSGRLSHLFRRQIGMSIVEFRTDQKLERVDQIFRSGAATDLLSASLDAGFGSYSQFYRAFVRRHRTPPGRYFLKRTETTQPPRL